MPTCFVGALPFGWPLHNCFRLAVTHQILHLRPSMSIGEMLSSNCSKSVTKQTYSLKRVQSLHVVNLN